MKKDSNKIVMKYKIRFIKEAFKHLIKSVKEGKDVDVTQERQVDRIDEQIIPTDKFRYTFVINGWRQK